MKRLFIWLIGLYQRRISPLKRAPTCRFVPTCSQYAKEAIELHGAFFGLALAIWRVIRCTPFFKGGYDPVPPPRQKRGAKSGGNTPHSGKGDSK